MTRAPTNRTQDPRPQPRAGAGLVLTFRLNGETFAIDVERVHEIIDPLPVTRVPRADPFVPSLINVRGAIVPVVDVRGRLGMRAADDGCERRFVVIETMVDDSSTRLALVVDGVSEVVEIADGAIEEIPELGARWPTEFIRGIAMRGEELVVLLNTQTLFRPGRTAARAINREAVA